MTPEAEARETIDQLLEQAGWVVIGPTKFPNVRQAEGVAVREAHMKTGYADYLLYVDGKALGVIEAKKKGTPLSSVEPQTSKYSRGVPDDLPVWLEGEDLPFLYESTSVETFFTDLRDPRPRSRKLFAFHTPQTLRRWVKDDDSLRGRLQQLPELIADHLWPPQVEAVTNLEQSLAENRPRALIQMATGAGKTFTAVNFVYRLVRYAKAHRVLFLVDRNNLGRQALTEFNTFTTPDDGRKFPELFSVQHLTSNHIPADGQNAARVTISTIQRIYAILRDEELEEMAEEGSLYEQEEAGDADVPLRTVSYTPRLPLEYFDFIVIDECHRSIYNRWRQVLEYFDAFLIGLTATPASKTVAFFHENQVMEYDHLQAVADGINVAGEVYRIRTEITESGATVREGDEVREMQRRTRDEVRRLLDEDFVYLGKQLGRDVMNQSQIRLVVKTFRDRLFTEIFPGRSGEHVPKTLIFAKDDNHAEEIVRIVRDEFAQGNDFCQKVTYKLEKRKKPDDVVSAFRNRYYPRIAVTVDMIATGTDVKPIECLIFLRMVRSRAYFMQMYGRGTRIIDPDQMHAVTKDAPLKDHFVLVDAVGVTDGDIMVDAAPTLNRQKSLKLDKLLQKIGRGVSDEKTLATTASRLTRLQRKLTEADQEALREICGRTLPELTRVLLHALDADAIVARGKTLYGETADLDEEQLDTAAAQLREEAVITFQGPDITALFTKLDELSKRTSIIYDITNLDRLVTAEKDPEATARAQETIADFRTFIEQNKDQITALRLIYEQRYDQEGVSLAQLSQLAEAIRQPPHNWTTATLWRAYEQVGRAPMRSRSELQVVTNLVALVRHTLRPEDATLAPYPELVQQRYEAWLAEQAAVGQNFSEEQRWWLDEIARQIGLSWGVSPSDLQTGVFAQQGGIFKAMDVLGPSWEDLLNEINHSLIVL